MTRHNLPAHLTSFVGREHELTQVRALLAVRRLVTLTGAPGVGKTRLGVQVAAGLVDTFRDGVWLVEFAPLTDPSLAPHMIANTLGVREQAGRTPTAALSDWLRSRRQLLLLDNCEHLVDAVAALVESLLQACPDLHVLATSREPLEIDGEVTTRVLPLSVPESTTDAALAASDAVRLFVDRVQASDPSFELTSLNAAAVAQICTQLDGIPLALELAAVRVRVFSVQDVAARLDDRFRLLTGSRRSGLERQETLRGAVDWSYNLLSAREQLLFRRLSVFAGRWTLEEAEQVCFDEQLPSDDILDTLASLVDKSLVQTVADDAGQARYRLLETLRQYGAAKLAAHGELAAIRDRHGDYFLEFANRLEPLLNGPDQVVARNQLEHALDDLRTALGWWLGVSAARGARSNVASTAAPQDPERGARLVAAIWRFWGLRGSLEEGRGWIDRAIAVSPFETSSASRASHASLHIGAAALAGFQGDYRTAISHMDQALHLWRSDGNKPRVGHALQRLGFFYANLGETEHAARLCEESVAIARADSDPLGLAHALRTAGHVAWRMQQFERSLAYCEESLALSRDIASPAFTAATLGGIARTLSELGDRTRAAQLFEESLTLFEVGGDQRGTADACKDLAFHALLDDDVDRVYRLLSRAIIIYQEIGDYANIGACLREFARATLLDHASAAAGPTHLTPHSDSAEDRLFTAARLWAAGDAPREAAGIVAGRPLRDRYEKDLSSLRAALGEAAFARAQAEGRAMPLERAVAQALAACEARSQFTEDRSDHASGAASPVRTLLTRREQEISSLVAEGLSNPQIAARLGLSDRTIDAHLRNIMGKLDVSSRAQVAAWSVRHDSPHLL